jgi:hypothetical protein
MHRCTTFLWGILILSTVLPSGSESTADEQQIAVRLSPPTQTLYSTVLQLPFTAAVNVEVDVVEFSRIRREPLSSRMHMKVFLLYSKGAEEEANHTLLDQPFSGHSFRQRLQLQLMTFNQFSVRVVVTDQVQIIHHLVIVEPEIVPPPPS